MAREPFSAIVLAGGRSARMGRVKSTLRFGGITLIERLVAELRRVAEDIVVVTAPDAEAIALPRLATAKIVRDEIAYQGPVGALARGLREASHDTAFACSCDLPMLRAEVVSWVVSLLSESSAYDAAIAQIGGKLQPLHAAYRRRCAAALDAMVERGERRLSFVGEAANVRLIGESEYRLIDPQGRSCFNINTPEDYARALELAGIPEQRS
jgi:molybdopterin-guanine dinucleotide biosynthesis protein A